MICPYCRQINPDNKRFCVRCLHELIVPSHTRGFIFPYSVFWNNGTESPVKAVAKQQSAGFPYP